MYKQWSSPYRLCLKTRKEMFLRQQQKPKLMELWIL
ncbi:hypothetical protein Goari_012644 [Gossypium aridum]|uniref:Uncharacterized protein n=1 Tax=Gossypium aridum TaxID=34290 RepID=A0A7J8X141_GOSAI|nr:hypothetical protein [Gossypium aridum]